MLRKFTSEGGLAQRLQIGFLSAILGSNPVAPENYLKIFSIVFQLNAAFKRWNMTKPTWFETRTSEQDDTALSIAPLSLPLDEISRLKLWQGSVQSVQQSDLAKDSKVNEANDILNVTLSEPEPNDFKLGLVAVIKQLSGCPRVLTIGIKICWALFTFLLSFWNFCRQVFKLRFGVGSNTSLDDDVTTLLLQTLVSDQLSRKLPPPQFGEINSDFCLFEQILASVKHLNREKESMSPVSPASLQDFKPSNPTEPPY